MDEVDVDPEQEPRVISFDDADHVIEALGSRTARSVMALLSEEPMPPSELATAVETSLQNVSYHLEQLSDAGLVDVVDTCYSSRGVEMDVYAPATGPVVICLGDEDGDAAVSRAIASDPDATTGLARSD